MITNFLNLESVSTVSVTDALSTPPLSNQSDRKMNIELCIFLPHRFCSKASSFRGILYYPVPFNSSNLQEIKAI